MNQRFGPLTCFLSMAMLAALSSDASAYARHKETQPAKKAEAKAEASGKAGHHREAAHKKDVARKDKKDVARKNKKDKDKHAARRKSEPAVKSSESADAPPLSGDLAAVKNAIDLVREGKTADATAAEKAIGDPAAQKHQPSCPPAPDRWRDG